MKEYSDKIINEIWEKASTVEGYDDTKFRKDACGAWIKRDKYNKKDSIFGWEIDHIYPKDKLKKVGVPEDKIDSLDNLRPLNWLNNESKGLNFPTYLSALTAVGNKNKREVNYFEIDKQTRDLLNTLYSEFL